MQVLSKFLEDFGKGFQVLKMKKTELGRAHPLVVITKNK